MYLHGLGSSPRMRGTHARASPYTVAPGLIPTYAGNTEDEPGRTRMPRAHPHVCGEHACHSWLLRLLLGSSPRMRGTLLLTVLRVSSSGLIPTYAGNTAVARHLTPLAGAHPHVCGEHQSPVINDGRGRGSSPRMRGTPLDVDYPDEGLGLIPTYAGNTTRGRAFSYLIRAHPHVCGEHDSSPSRRVSFQGSSPRMRGTRRLGFRCWRCRGLIPTYAGNTRAGARKHGFSGAHPHVCGEHPLSQQAYSKQ